MSTDGDDLEVIDPEPDPVSSTSPSPTSSSATSSTARGRSSRPRRATVVVAGALVLAVGSFAGASIVHRVRNHGARTSDTIVLPPAPATTATPPASNPVSNPVSNPDAEFIGQMGVISPGAGWALNGLALYRTVDDTAHWTDITPPGVDDPIAHIDALDFVDADHAWLAVTLDNQPFTIDRTTDGGRSWSSVRPSACGSTPAANVARCGSPVAIDFIDQTRGWAVFSTNDTSANLLATVDGGRTWTVVGSTPFVGTVHFASAATGWGVGIHGALYRTNDGGKAWHPIRLPVATDVDTGSLAIGRPQFFGADDVVSARLMLRPTGAPTLAVYASSDDGSTWTRRAAPIDPVVNIVNYTDYRFSASSPTDWALLYGTHLSVTHDAGRHWSSVTPTAGVLDDVALASRTSAWVLAPPAPCPTPGDDCADALLFHTSDGGATWRAGSPTIGITAGRLP